MRKEITMKAITFSYQHLAAEPVKFRVHLKRKKGLTYHS